MLDTYKELIKNQFEAAFCALNACADLCPDELWDKPVAKNPYCQSVFHTLIFADLYLEPGMDGFRDQPFHQEHPEFFGDYEQLEPREPVGLYTKEDIRRYLNVCRQKAAAVIDAEEEETLKGPSGFSFRKCTRAELHVYNMRHIQHHIAQLNMRLRLDTDLDPPWVGHAWKELDG